MNNNITIYKKEILTNSKGTAISNQCQFIEVYQGKCSFIQQLDRSELLQNYGFESSKNIYRFDFYIKDIDNIQILPTMYIITNKNGIKNNYKIIKVLNRTILGCLHVTLFTENENVRDGNITLETYKNIN